jgi:hypothetical protein
MFVIQLQAVFEFMEGYLEEDRGSLGTAVGTIGLDKGRVLSNT